MTALSGGHNSFYTMVDEQKGNKMLCKYCNGRKYIPIELKEKAGTAINTIHKYIICPKCQGTGEEPWRIVSLPSIVYPA